MSLKEKNEENKNKDLKKNNTQDNQNASFKELNVIKEKKETESLKNEEEKEITISLQNNIKEINDNNNIDIKN